MSSWIETQIDLLDQALDGIGQLSAMNDPKCDDAANHLSMVVLPGILKTIRDRVAGPGRDVLITSLEERVHTRLKQIADANGVKFDIKTVKETEIKTNPNDWMLKC